jgi:hypothetical protein
MRILTSLTSCFATPTRICLQSYLQSGGKIADLSEAEMFALDLARVPRCEARLRTFQLKFTALETLQEAKQILQGHTAAAEEIQSSMCASLCLPCFVLVAATYRIFILKRILRTGVLLRFSRSHSEQGIS